MLDVITADHIDAELPWPFAIDVLRTGFLAGDSVTTPQRHHHSMGTDDDSPTLLLMPSWSDQYAGVKLVTVFPATSTTDLGAACAAADIVTCATMSSTPVVSGGSLNVGCHLDLVGAFTPAMRETDDVAIRRARVFVDTMAGALTEAGDILQPIQSGALRESDIEADFFSLCRGFEVQRADDDITLFKSVGHALEDLVSAAAVYEALRQPPA